jgi:hypothetical protein
MLPRRSRGAVARWSVGVLALLAARATAAQATPAATTPARAAAAGDRQPDALCWRGRPLARCRAFLLFEFSAPRQMVGSRLDPIVSQNGYGHPRWDQGLASQFVYDVGAMVNVDARSAVGGTIEAGMIVDDPSDRLVLGVTGRYRRWLTRHVSADAGAGLLRMPVGVVETEPYGIRRVSVQRPALMGELRLGLGDLVAVGSRAMVANDGRGRTHGALFVGASVGSTVTAAVTGATALLIGRALLFGGQGDEVVVQAARATRGTP